MSVKYFIICLLFISNYTFAQNLSQIIQDAEANLETSNVELSIYELISKAQATIRNINFDKQVTAIDMQLDVNKVEVKTHDGSKGLSFNFFGLIKGEASEYEDSTKFVIQNPKEIKQYSVDRYNNYQQMTHDLESYIDQHKEEIAQSKQMVALAMALSNSLPSSTFEQLYPKLKKLHQNVQRIEFRGALNSLECVQTSYIDQRKSLAFSISALFMSAAYNDEVNKKAYSETTCESHQDTVQLSANTLALYELEVADLMLKRANKVIELKRLELKADFYPTWGLY